MAEPLRPDMLIIGAAGQVGGALADVLGPRAIGTFRQTPVAGGIAFDLESLEERPGLANRLIEQACPRVALIAAGFTNVEACEGDPRRAICINAQAPGHVARAVHRAGGRSVYFSTEYVFDGASGPYEEAETPRPLSVYGQSKLLGEQLVAEADPNALIIRTTVVYGPERLGKNFACQLRRRLGEGLPMRVARDQVSTPTYNRDLAAATLRLIETNARGVFHVAGEELLDRAAFATRLARACGLDERLIEPVSTASLEQKASRPLQAGLQIAKLRQVVPDLVPRSIEQAIGDWLAHGGTASRAA